MDSSQSSSHPSSLDSLRTVEFRQTLRGYHIDDVDEYLERVAVEAESLQEQVRLSGERLRQAADRIAQLEQTTEQLEQKLEQVPAPASAPQVSDDSLQRTLLLAQKFVDQTEAEAEAHARAMLADAEARARALMVEAETNARALTEESERHLREDIARLESIRTHLAGDVETMARHLDTERNRLRTALGDMLRWIEEHVQPSSSLLAQPPSTSADGDVEPSTTPETSTSEGPRAEAARPLHEDTARPVEARPVQTPPVAGFPVPESGPSSAERQGMMPLGEPQGARTAVPH